MELFDENGECFICSTPGEPKVVESPVQLEHAKSHVATGSPVLILGNATEGYSFLIRQPITEE